MVQITIAAAQILWLVLAAYYDIAGRLIPNRICIGLALAGLIARLQFGFAPIAISAGITAGLFLPLLFMFVRNWIGGGDVKLLTAMALGLSPMGTALLIYIMALAGGVLSLTYLGMRYLPRPNLANSRSVLRRIYAVERWRIFKHAPVPYGVAIACGGIWAVLTTGV